MLLFMQDTYPAWGVLYVDLVSYRTTYKKGTRPVSLYGRPGTVILLRIQNGVNAKEAGVHLGVTGLDGNYSCYPII